MRVVIVPGTLALLPEYASVEDPIPDLRAAVREAVAWLVEKESACFASAAPAGQRMAEHLLGDRLDPSGPGLLVVANGSAMRTEKAPGHFDDRAAGFDAAIAKALAAGEPARLADIDLGLAEELWARPDADVLRNLADHVPAPVEVRVDYDDAPYGVQYWVVRWQC